MGVAVCLLVAIAAISDRVEGAQADRPWSVDGSIQGSFNSAGQIFKVDTRVSYSLADYFEIGGGLPVYLVRAADSADLLAGGWSAGPGNAFVDLRLIANRTDWSFTSGIRGAAPTGDRDRGFSTGKVSVDWTNSLALYLPAATLFGSAGVANSVSDTSFFVRPFTTTGLVGHFDGGLFVPFNSWLGVGGLGYAVTGGGEQRVVSRLIQTDRTGPVDRRRGFETRVETRGQDLADDHGFSGWLDVAPGSDTSFQVGYTRSIPYAYDTLFFSVGFDIY